MHYLLAIIGAVTVAVLLWRVFLSDRIGAPTERATIAPDDDPDFLRKLKEQQRKKPDEDP
jgi:hypothetical protein